MAPIEEQRTSAEGLQIPGLVQSQEPVEQLSFTLDPLTPVPLAASSQPEKIPGLMGRFSTPSPISQDGIGELGQSAPAFYAGGSSSLPGLEDMDTARQPVAQAEAVDTQAFQSVPASYPGGSNSLPGLEDMDTTHQPAVQARSTEAQNSQVSTPGFDAGMNSPQSPNADDNGLTGPASQAGLGSAPGMNSTDVSSQPASQDGQGKALTTRVLLNPNVTRVLRLDSQPGITRTLEEARPVPNTTASRPPMVIRGTNQPKRARSIRPPQGRRHVISIAGIGLLLVITLGTLLLASPIGQNVRATFSAQPNGGGIVQNTPSNMSLVAQATATAVVHQQNDGYDPTSGGGGPVVTGSPHSWPLGVCTYWANLRYHELTGNWVTWLGNAYQWADGARLAGWHVSTSPHVPSIIVLMPGVQGASGYGHVAVVESASGSSVYTSNMNWYADGGGWDIESHYTFTAGSGVYFIWA
jgi:surface antigen